MEGSSSSAHVPESPSSAEEYAEKAERAEWIRRLFPVDSTNDSDIQLSVNSEQQAMGSKSNNKPLGHSYLVILPPEIIGNIVSCLNNRTIKNLRLTCRRLAAVAELHITRVFLSANPLNIQVFRAIANHDRHRHRIVEIIYDDARLWSSAVDAAEAREPGRSDLFWTDIPSDLGWFRSERDANIQEINHRRGTDDIRRPEHVAMARRMLDELSLKESWAYYHDLLRQQEEVIASGADADALRYGLQRFPSLRKVTVTPQTHGWLFMPLYVTPMIRAFPPGLNCPIPRAWPYALDSPIHAAPWENEKERWRGFNLVTKILAEGQHNVSEYEIDGHHLGTGLNCRLFDEPCDEYDDFVSILSLPGLKKLRLSLFVDGQDSIDSEWWALRNGLLPEALAKATELEHVSIATGWNPEGRIEPPGLGRFLPIDCWPKLQHFELWHVGVNQAELLSVISQLPDGLLSLQLNFLTIHDTGNYRDLLNAMRDRLHWHEQRPQARVIIGVPVDEYIRGRAIWIDEEIDSFFKGNGKNPFEDDDGQELDNVPRFGMGVVRDAFDPNYVRPWVDFSTYQKLGYAKRSAGECSEEP
ncbi:hypothetical protein V8C35DRAFT_297866 [Trichoderma chlorosporum]